VSPGILPSLPPLVGVPRAPQPSPGRGRSGGKLGGGSGVPGGQSSPVPPPGFAGLGAQRATPWVLGTPSAGGPGQPGDPRPRGVPPAQGSPFGSPVTDFTLPSTPRAPLPPPSCPGLLLGPAMPAPPRTPLGTLGMRGRGPGWGSLAAPSGGEWVSGHSIPGAGHAVCRGSEPGPGRARRGLRGAQRAGGSSPAPGGVRTAGRVCLKPSLPPPGGDLSR